MLKAIVEDEDFALKILKRITRSRHAIRVADDGGHAPQHLR